MLFYEDDDDKDDDEYYPRHTYPGDPQGSDVLAVGCRPIAAAPQPCQDAAQTLHRDATVNSVSGRSRGTRETSTGVVIPDRLHGRCEYPCHHAQDRGDAHSRKTPLTWGKESERRMKGRGETQWDSSRGIRYILFLLNISL